VYHPTLCPTPGMAKTRIKRQNFRNAVRQPDTSWPAYQLKWDRYDYAVMPIAAGKVLAQFNYRLCSLRTLRWPQEGIFVPQELTNPSAKEPKARDRYDPAEVADKILLDVQRMDADNPKAVLGFVNRWGVLKVGIRGDDEFPFDGVTATGDHIRSIQKWMNGFHSLRNGTKTSAHWDDLIPMLNAMLTHIRPAAKRHGRILVPFYFVDRLIDALFLELWQLATDGRRLLRCPECQALFLPGRANQEYCNRLCANRPTVRRAKQRRREKMAASKRS